MPRHRRYEPLNIFLNSRLVGQLRRAPSGATAFQYDGSWLAWEHTMPVSLSLPLQEDAFSGAPVRAVFENLLPDKDELRRRIAARAHAEGTDAYSLLSAIGHDCVGALQFSPPEREPKPTPKVIQPNGTTKPTQAFRNDIFNFLTSPWYISPFCIVVDSAQIKLIMISSISCEVLLIIVLFTLCRHRNLIRDGDWHACPQDSSSL